MHQPDIISYANFYKLRLQDFLPNNPDILLAEGFEFMDDIWIGECYGFTQWLRLESDPLNTRSISLALENLPDITITEIFTKIQINLKKGIKKDDVFDIFGNPVNTLTFIKGKKTYEYIIGNKQEYYLSLTVHNDNGLIYVVLMSHKKTIVNLKKKLNKL